MAAPANENNNNNNDDDYDDDDDKRMKRKNGAEGRWRGKKKGTNMYSIMNRQAEEDTGLIDAVCISVYVNLNYVDNYFVFDQNK